MIKNKTICCMISFMCLFTFILTACTSDSTSLDSFCETTLTNEELSFLTRYTNNDKRITSEQAEEVVLSSTSLTRSANIKVIKTDVLLKQNLNLSIDSIYNILPDTLVYLIYTDDGFVSAIPADSRVETRLLGRIPQSQIYNITNETDGNVKDIICQMFMTSVISEICKYEAEKDSLRSIVLNKLTPSVQWVTRARQPQGFSSEQYDFLVVEGSTSSQQVAFKNSMIPWNWHQRMPYNRFVRYKQPCGTVPAGCVPVSIGLLMTYWGHPASVDGHYMNWGLMRDVFWESDSAQVGAVDIAYLLKQIGEGIGANYQCGSTTASLSDGISWLHNHGYQGGSASGYNYNTIKSSISSGKPVLIRGVDNDYNGERVGHAWVIDGYEEIRYDTQVSIYAIHKITGKQYFLRNEVRQTYDHYLSNNFGNYNSQTWICSPNTSSMSFTEGDVFYKYDICIYTGICPN